MTDKTAAVVPDKPENQMRAIWSQFVSHKGAAFGLAVLSILLIAVILGPLLWHPAKPTVLEALKAKNLGPSFAHPLGTDQIGRDMLVRMIAAGKVSMAVGFVAMAIATVFGTTIGILAGYFRRILFRDKVAAIIGPELGAFTLIVFAIGITSWMQAARIVRGVVLSLKEREYVLASRSIGAPPRRIILRHILPNVISPVMVAATLGIAEAIITESVLSFLGLGFPPDFPTWGRLLFDGLQYMQLYPERVIWPGLAISLTVLSVNYIGDGLRDALDPRIRGR
jgi:peptide/nickel transport system permease protein